MEDTMLGATMQVAAQHGHRMIVDFLAEQGADPDAKDSEGDRPLLLAVGSGHTEVSKRLLELKAEVEWVSSQNVSALQMAVLKGKAPLARLLLKAGARMTVQDEDGEPGPRQHIHAAAAMGHSSVVQALLDHGADVMLPGQDGFVPSFLAAEQGHAKVLRLLADRGADLRYKLKASDEILSSEDGEVPEATVYSIAAARGHIPILKYLLESASSQTLGAVSKELGKKHGMDWQQKFDKALKVQERTKASEKWTESLADPEKAKRLEEFREMYSKLSPEEKKKVDERLQTEAEARAAQRSYEEKQKRKRVSAQVDEL